MARSGLRRDMTYSTPTHGTRNPAVLEPTFVEGLHDLPVDEIRRRRDQALAEREYVSYLRRIVQVRQDMLRIEQERRTSGAAPGHIVDRLTKVLSEGPPRTSRGEALRFSLTAQEMEDADRRVQEILGSLAHAPAEGIGDDELSVALAALTEEERAVSASRKAVFRVHDALQDELKRRFRDDPSSVQPPV
jgi:hypothetical protein